ncbi:rhodanese-like domain-containing protein [Oceanobacillus sp. CF4.6]|uniref:rhodanese-like domain-containing protein n=1 Tax=Oceanobacillus sp. CF4.6 TaxID=3373080 RepID=UPI003EE73277
MIVVADIKEITPTEVEELMNKDNIVVIDVREDEEVAQGIIEKAKHIPLGEIPEAASELDKNKDYILVCRSGARSMNASKYLNEQGFKVINMKGGMLKWEGEVIV